MTYTVIYGHQPFSTCWQLTIFKLFAPNTLQIPSAQSKISSSNFVAIYHQKGQDFVDFCISRQGFFPLPCCSLDMYFSIAFVL